VLHIVSVTMRGTGAPRDCKAVRRKPKALPWRNSGRWRRALLLWPFRPCGAEFNSLLPFCRACHLTRKRSAAQQEIRPPEIKTIAELTVSRRASRRSAGASPSHGQG
jgi:hypothetical protein